MIPYGKQDINQDDIDAVIEVLSGVNITQGSKVPEFENCILSSVNAKYGVAVNSATSALHIACLALGVTKDDVVWTSPISFVASANCALYCGAKIDFVDVELPSGNMSIEALKQKLMLCKSKELPIPKVVIPVHMAGYSCDMLAIKQLSEDYGFAIIEDASHAIGASYFSDKIGCCRYSDITVFSFHPVKIITTAEGGMAVTNNKYLADKMRLLRSHGIEKKDYVGDNPAWYYEQKLLGFNYRMTDIQAALGISQANRLDQFLKSRRELAERYFYKFKYLPIDLPPLDAIQTSSWHLFIVHVRHGNRRKVFDHLRANNIGVHVHYIPIYKQPYYHALGFNSKYCPQAEIYYSSSLSIPIFHGMTLKEQDEVILNLREAIE